MSLLVVENIRLKVRAAVDTDRLAAELDFSQGYAAEVRRGARMLREFLEAWHAAEDKTAVSLPSWMIYIHSDPEIGKGHVEAPPQ